MLRIAALLVCLAAHAASAADTERVFSELASGVVEIQVVGQRSDWELFFARLSTLRERVDALALEDPPEAE